MADRHTEHRFTPRSLQKKRQVTSDDRYLSTTDMTVNLTAQWNRVTRSVIWVGLGVGQRRPRPVMKSYEHWPDISGWRDSLPSASLIYDLWWHLQAVTLKCHWPSIKIMVDIACLEIMSRLSGSYRKLTSTRVTQASARIPVRLLTAFQPGVLDWSGQS